MIFLKNLKEFLLEQKKSKDKTYTYGCAMLYFDFPDMDNLHKEIDENDIYTEDGFGLEDEPHTTLLYGFHADEINDDNEIFDTILDFEISNLILYNASLFENEYYDVLKFDVKAKEYEENEDDFLFEINKTLTDKFPYTTDYPDYHPHATIGYLKKGKGKKYVEIFKDKEFEVVPSKIVYSKPNEDGTGTIKTDRKINI